MTMMPSAKRIKKSPPPPNNSSSKRNPCGGNGSRMIPIPSFATSNGSDSQNSNAMEGDNNKAKTLAAAAVHSQHVEPPPPPLWNENGTTNEQETRRMEQLVAGLLQRSSHGHLLLHEVEDLIRKVWIHLKASPARPRQNLLSSRSVAVVLWKLLTCALAALADDNTTPGQRRPLFLLQKRETSHVLEVNRGEWKNPLSQFLQAWRKPPPRHQKMAQHQLWTKLLNECTVSEAAAKSSAVIAAAKVDPKSLLVAAEGPKSAEKRVVKSSVEERVRERAARKRQQQAQLQEQDEQDSVQNKSLDQVSSLLMPLANGLWSHAHAIQQRQASAAVLQHARTQRLGLSNTAITASRVAMTLRDVVALLQTALKHSCPRRQAVAAVHELVQRLPEWLVLSPHRRSTDPNATLWISPGLSRDCLVRKLQGTSESLVHKPKATLSSSKSSSSQDSAPDDHSKPENSETPPYSPPPRVNLDAGGSDDDEIRRPKKARRSLLFGGPVAFSSTPLDQPPTNRSHITPPSPALSPESSPSPKSPSSKPSSTLKRRKPAAKRPTQQRTRQRVVNDEKLQSPRQRKYSLLRVNPNLILSDADYTGGEKLVPGRYDSPRALTGLFWQMKHGQRI